MQKVCIVCKKNPKKYKCPKCKNPYCSIECNLIHKETCSTAYHSTTEHNPALACQVSITPQDPEIIKSNFIEDEELRIPLSKLQQLKNNQKLISMLKNPQMRNVLMKIDNSKERITELQKAMLNQQFLQMADTILDVVDPEKVQQNYLS